MKPARTLSQILAEISPVYSSQIKNIRARQSELPTQIAAEEQGLEAKQTRAFDDILGGARRRGLGFSGIPLGEQAQYTATEFLPAMARLRQTGREQAMSLEDAIYGIRERQQGQALGLRQYEQQRYDQWKAQQEALAEQRRAAAAQQASYASLFNQQQQAQKLPQQNQKQALRESDAAYLGRVQQSIRDLPAFYESLRNGTADAKRRYKLAVELGYVPNSGGGLTQLSAPGLRVISNTGGLTF